MKIFIHQMPNGLTFYSDSKNICPMPPKEGDCNHNENVFEVDDEMGKGYFNNPGDFDIDPKGHSLKKKDHGHPQNN